jgi:hypothetical protein
MVKRSWASTRDGTSAPTGDHRWEQRETEHCPRRRDPEIRRSHPPPSAWENFGGSQRPVSGDSIVYEPDTGGKPHPGQRVTSQGFLGRLARMSRPAEPCPGRLPRARQSLDQDAEPTPPVRDTLRNRRAWVIPPPNPGSGSSNIGPAWGELRRGRDPEVLVIVPSISGTV